MADERPPLILRPIHVWFQLWEGVVPSLYRVVAVAVAVAVTAIAVTLLVPVHWFVVLAVASAGWVGLAIIQEHDERVVLGVDDEFLSLLRTQVDPVLARAGFTFRTASGPARTRRDRADTYLYEADSDDGCIDLWILRDRSAGGELQVLVDGRALERIVDSIGEPQQASRVTVVVDATADVTALVAALELLLRNDYFRRFHR